MRTFLCFFVLLAQAAAQEIVSLDKIWDQGAHNAFTDLVRYRNTWFCTFREDTGHASAAGKIRVIESRDGKSWKSAALIEESGIDLRDPKFAVAPDGRLMVVLGGSIMENKQYVNRRPRVSFSRDGRKWSAPQPFLEDGDWLWRVTWHKGKAYGVSYHGGGGLKNVKRRAFLYVGDGVKYELIRELEPSETSESTIRFAANDEMVVLSRSGNETRIGTSPPPYKTFQWTVLPGGLGGPNFIMLPDGRWAAGSRARNKPGPETVLSWMTRTTYTPFLTLPSAGDNSYPGLVWHDGLLWVSYYSTHEGKTSIYLARVRLPAAR